MKVNWASNSQTFHYQPFATFSWETTYLNMFYKIHRLALRTSHVKSLFRLPVSLDCWPELPAVGVLKARSPAQGEGTQPSTRSTCSRICSSSVSPALLRGPGALGLREGTRIPETQTPPSAWQICDFHLAVLNIKKLLPGWMLSPHPWHFRGRNGAERGEWLTSLRSQCQQQSQASISGRCCPY